MPGNAGTCGVDPSATIIQPGDFLPPMRVTSHHHRTPVGDMRIAVALGLLLAAGAQDRPETVIRTTTRLVQVRVVAEDSKGNPVTNLRKEEFQLQDNRKPQPIAL